MSAILDYVSASLLVCLVSPFLQQRLHVPVQTRSKYGSGTRGGPCRDDIAAILSPLNSAYLTLHKQRCNYHQLEPLYPRGLGLQASSLARSSFRMQSQELQRTW